MELRQDFGDIEHDGELGPFPLEIRVQVSDQLQRTWTPVLTATGGGTITTSAVDGEWTRLPNGGIWVYYNIVVSGVSGVSGNLSITGLPSNLVCLGRVQPGQLGLYSGFTGLNGAPWGQWVQNQAIINLLEPGSSGTAFANLAASKLTTSSSFSGTAVCNLPQ